MTEDTILRPARADERDALIGVVRDTGLLQPEEVEVFAATISGTLAGARPDHRWFVLDRGGLTGSAYAAPGDFQPDVWDLWFIGLLPAARRQGGGRRLVAAVEAAARGAGARLLIVETGGTANHAGARAFYRAQGFDEEARIRDYYAPGDDKVIFRKAL